VGATCRALVFLGGGRHEIRDFPVPDPPPGGAVLEVEAVGLCGSDLAQHQGVELVPGASVFPVVPGHEIVGRVWKLGADAGALGVREGQRVAVNEVLSTEPPFVVYGYSMSADEQPGLFGGYGEYMVVLPGTRLYPMSDRLPAAEVTMFEPLANAVNWVETVGVEPGDTVVIEGPGHQGLAVLEAALAVGAGTVIVTGAAGDELRLAAAREIGAHHTIDVSKQDPVEVVRDLTGGVGPDVVMDIASVVHTVPVAVELVRFRGRILLAGLKHFEAIPGLVTDNIVVKGLKVFGGSGFTPESMGRAVQLIEDAKVNTGAVRGEVFGLDGMEEALRLLARAEPGRDAVRVSLEHAHAG
jgi:threonine dehydrogenase-like Zn-dependent dehydrogenase